MSFLLPSFLFALLGFASCSKRHQPVEQAAVIRTIRVANATELKNALVNAAPGDRIELADGTYTGRFVIPAQKDGTISNPVELRGSANAVLDGGSTQTGYVLHIQSSNWKIKGITITNGLKGIMADGVSGVLIDSVKVFHIGEEGIHLRKASHHNVISNCEVKNVGLKTPGFGEGIYIGSAKSNWATYTNGAPDLCDSNLVYKNRLGPGITAECIDIKEGTTGGIIRENYFDATGITGANSADSWMDLKGNGYVVEGNTGYNAQGSFLQDGYQVNVAYPGWGNNNLFRNNNSTVNAPGYGIHIRLSSSSGTSTGNKVFINNTATGASSGISNIPLSNQ